MPLFIIAISWLLLLSTQDHYTLLNTPKTIPNNTTITNLNPIKSTNESHTLYFPLVLSVYHHDNYSVLLSYYRIH